MCIILALEIVEMAKLGSTESPRARPVIFRRLPMAGNPWRYSHIRRPRPSPRQGRRLGPPQVWNLSFLASNAPMLRAAWIRGSLGLACRLPPQLGVARPTPAGISFKATSMASWRSSMPFASLSTLPML